jgi:hypothetical protein
MIERNRWQVLAWQVLGFSAAVGCGMLIVSALQPARARAECMPPPSYRELLRMEKSGVVPLGSEDDPGNLDDVNAQWPDRGVLGSTSGDQWLDIESDLWAPYCHSLDPAP